MPTHVAILRGINVGGHRKILMKDLKTLFSKNGFKNATTYIQSGNIVFDSVDGFSNLELADKIEKLIAKHYKFDVPVIVRTKSEWEDAIASNPFFKESQSDINELHCTFLKNEPLKEDIESIKLLDFPPDKFEIINDNVFIRCLGKYHETKLSNALFEKKLKVTTTTRNWKTVLKIGELLKI